MTRDSRVRTKTRPFPPGNVTGSFFGGPINLQNDGIAYKSVCTDYHGRPVTVSSLSIDEIDLEFNEPVNGGVGIPGGLVYTKATNYIPSFHRGYVPLHLALPDMPSEASQMTTLLARTSPSRPDYVPLTLLQDLYDIPRQLKDVGRLITTKKSKLLTPREVGNQYLGFQFGWKPLFQDVKDLLDLQGHIHKRTGELQRLYESGGLKRRIHLGRWSAASDQIITTESQSWLTIQSRFSKFTSANRWGTVRWLPLDVPNHRPSDAEIIRKAKEVVLGLSLEATLKGAWDLIPWTWIIDWFTNISEFALQYSNSVPAVSSEACVMTQTDTMYQIVPVSITTGYKGGSGFHTRVAKQRYVGSGSLDVHLPFIGADRLSILSALFVQRFRR